MFFVFTLLLTTYCEHHNERKIYYHRSDDETNHLKDAISKFVLLLKQILHHNNLLRRCIHRPYICRYVRTDHTVRYGIMNCDQILDKFVPYQIDIKYTYILTRTFIAVPIKLIVSRCCLSFAHFLLIP